MESMLEYEFTAGNGTNSTADSIPMYLGFICCGLSSFFFGTNFIPIKKFDTGDGMFFQWVLCNAIVLVGLVIQMIRTSQFFPFVMIGGFIWATGNICVVPILKTIGLGLGMCVWGSINLFVGWAFGRFGAFGTTPEVPSDIPMNYVGVALCLFSTVVYSMVKPDVAISKLEMTIDVDSQDDTLLKEDEPLLSPKDENIQNRPGSDSLYRSNSEDVLVRSKKRRESTSSKTKENASTDDETFIDKLSPVKKKIIGIVLCVLSGICYGAQFTPAIYIQNNVQYASQDSLDYVFAHFCGIYLTSTIYFVVYIIAQRNTPRVYPKVILPGLVSGAMWGIGTASWFMANKALSEPVSFPIISTMPGGIALLIGILIFKEVKDRRNLVTAAVGISITITGATLAGLSKR